MIIFLLLTFAAALWTFFDARNVLRQGAAWGRGSSIQERRLTRFAMPSNGSACSLGVRERSERCIPWGALEQTWPGQRPKGIPIACQALIKIVLHVNPVTAIRTAAGHLHKLHKLPKISATERGSEREREREMCQRMRRNGRPVVCRAQSAIRTTMQHYNNVHFYGQLTAADAINALSNAHHGNANVAYEGGAREKVANLKETGAETYFKGNKVKKRT